LTERGRDRERKCKVIKRTEKIRTGKEDVKVYQWDYEKGYVIIRKMCVRKLAKLWGREKGKGKKTKG